MAQTGPLCEYVQIGFDQRPLLRQLDLRVVDHGALEAAPAVVREHADLRLRAEVDLLVLGRADVADPEVARLPVEREPPRVAEPHPDRLPPRARAVRREPQQLAERAAEVLRVVLRIAGRDVAGGWVGAAVAEADVEPALLVELELAALVIRIRLLHHEQVVRARRHADAVRRGELGDVAVAVQVAVVDVELVVLRVARVEREREETALAVVEHAAAQVEKRAGDLPVAHHLDRPALLDDVQRRRVAGRRGDVHRLVQAGRDLHEGRRRARGGAGRRGQRNENDGKGREAKHAGQGYGSYGPVGRAISNGDELQSTKGTTRRVTRSR